MGTYLVISVFFMFFQVVSCRSLSQLEHTRLQRQAWYVAGDIAARRSWAVLQAGRLLRLTHHQATAN